MSIPTVVLRTHLGDHSSSSVYSPFSDRVEHPPHNTPFQGVLMKTIHLYHHYQRTVYRSSVVPHTCCVKLYMIGHFNRLFLI